MSDYKISVSCANGGLNSSNSTFSKREQHRDSIFNSIDFLTASYFFIIVGSVALIMNFFIFYVLVQKKRKMANEYFVVAHLLVDGSYGLLLVSIGVINLTDVDIDNITGIDFLNCSIGKVPSTFLIFASLCLVLLVALNRYYAVIRPIPYKDIFSRKKVRVYLAAIFICSLIVASVDLATCITDPALETKFATSFSVFYIYAKLALVIIAAIALFVVYRTIARHFSQSFWSPIGEPFRSCFKPQEQNANVNHDPVGQNLANQHHRRLAQNEQTPLQEARQNQYEAIVNFHSDEHREPREVEIDLEQPTGTDHFQHSPLQTPNNTSQTRASVRYIVRFNVARDDENQIEVMATEGEPGPPPTPTQLGTRRREGKQRRGRNTKRNLTPQQQKHYVTTIFFFVCIAFLVVSLPSSLANVINHFLDDYLSVKTQFRIYLFTEALYGINFVLNPYLFSFNNSHLREWLSKHKLTKWIMKSQDGIN